MPYQRITLPPSSFCRFSSNRDDPNHSFIHPLRREAQLLIFCIINLASSVGNASHSSHLSQCQKVPRSTRWNQKLHNSQKLCNNNKSRPSWLMWKSWLTKMKSCERQWNPKMQNVGKQLKTKMKKNQTPKPTGETGPQEKIPQGWRMGFATWGRRWTS